MGRLIDVELNEERVKIAFPYDRELVDVVRTLPDRWYDRDSKNWFVPLQHLNYVIRRLDGYHFKYSPRLREFRADSDGDIAEVDKSVVLEVPDGTWTVSKLNQAAREALRDRFDQSLWIVGELQDFEKNRASNYKTFFFDLVERPFAGANEVARLKAVLFERDRKIIAKKLRESDIDLADGVAVRLRGKVDLYPRNGRYQIIVDDIDPAYTAGEIELNRERVFQILKKKQIESQNQEMTWPTCPLRVGLITSFESDAYNDFVHQLEQSERGFSIAVHHANVQGVHTERSVLRALNYFRENADDFDIIAIVRGGGSRSELAYFDTEAIGEAVCRHPVKIVCGVGHQRDISLLDLITESTKTPTAAAGRIVEKVDEFVGALHEVYASIARIADRAVSKRRQKLVRNSTRLERQVVQRLEVERRRQDRLQSSVGESTRRHIGGKRRELESSRQSLRAVTRRRSEGWERQLDRARRELSKRRLLQRLQRDRQGLDRHLDILKKASNRDTGSARTMLDRLEEQLQLVDPRRILERGFAMVRDQDGLIRSHRDVALGHDFDVVFGDGLLRARRIEKESDSEQSVEPESTAETVE